MSFIKFKSVCQFDRYEFAHMIHITFKLTKILCNNMNQPNHTKKIIRGETYGSQ